MTMREEKYKLLNELQLQKIRYEKKADHAQRSFEREYYAGMAHGFKVAIRIAEEMQEE